MSIFTKQSSGLKPLKNQPLWGRVVEWLTEDKSIRAALKDRGRHHYGTEDGGRETEPDTFWTWFYAIKAVICLKLGWEFKENREEGLYGACDGIAVGWHSGASYYSMDCFNAYGWNTVYVGVGLFTGWWASDIYDTNC